MNSLHLSFFKTGIKLSVCLLCLIIGHETVMGQLNLQRSVIGSTGSYMENGTLSLSYTVGEVATRKAVGNSGTLILTQGFQQPDDILLSIGNKLNIKLDYQIYPNPTPEELHVSLVADKAVELEVGIYDLRGRNTPIPSQKELIQGVWNLSYNLGELADGYYLLSIKNTDGEIVKSFKIKKIE